MKYLLILLLFLATACGQFGVPLLTTDYTSDYAANLPPNSSLPTGKNDFRHFYGIAWRGNPNDNLKYAKRMGHKFIFYQEGMELLAEANSMQFFIESPELSLSPLSIDIDINKNYSETEKAWYQSMACWRDNTAQFPHNIATGWPRNETTSQFLFDLQQQKVIDYLVDVAMTKIKSIQAKNSNFKFYGFAWDEANYRGDFFSHKYSRSSKKILLIQAIQAINQAGFNPTETINTLKNLLNTNDVNGLAELQLTHQAISPIINLIIPLYDNEASFRVPISYWTSNDSCQSHDGITHEYGSYTDGAMAYYKTIMQAARALQPEAKWLIEPYNIYNDWLRGVENRSDLHDVLPDYFSQETNGVLFIDDNRIYMQGLITKSNVGSSSPESSSEEDNRNIASKAACHGSWFNWYGRFGGSKSGTMPNFQNIYEVPAWLKLIRVIPGWDNLNQIPLQSRNCNDGNYTSSNSKITKEIIYSHHPNGKEIFVVFQLPGSKLELNTNEAIHEIWQADSFLIPQQLINNQLEISGNTILLRDNNFCGSPFIIKLK